MSPLLRLRLRLDRRRALREREAARAALGKVRLRPRAYPECEDCGGPLPYGGYVATPLCDKCLDKPAGAKTRPQLLAALSDLRAEAHAAGLEDIAMEIHKLLMFKLTPPPAVVVRRPGDLERLN